MINIVLLLVLLIRATVVLSGNIVEHQIEEQDIEIGKSISCRAYLFLPDKGSDLDLVFYQTRYGII